MSSQIYDIAFSTTLRASSPAEAVFLASKIPVLKGMKASATKTGRVDFTPVPYETVTHWASQQRDRMLGILLCGTPKEREEAGLDGFKTRDEALAHIVKKYEVKNV